MFNMQDRTLDGLDARLLITAADNAMLGLIGGILEDNGIAYILKDREAGDYMRVLGGYSIFGTDIYVREAQFNEAKGLIDAYVRGGEAQDASAEDGDA